MGTIDIPSTPAELQNPLPITINLKCVVEGSFSGQATVKVTKVSGDIEIDGDAVATSKEVMGDVGHMFLLKLSGRAKAKIENMTTGNPAITLGCNFTSMSKSSRYTVGHLYGSMTIHKSSDF